ncbi:uncharacterized protein N0V89_009365 [Didymosphaeria variabile]|uniref:[histone H3]-trimethyl-L-lysine(9) demethylase n=1 Tax=Didymosphaeria variabile TaxID=1932322 RepID=A0A9W8XFE6_9PLEO|nr:uncharacterized protein N0V89_009365 [Didymosphaeria variabile]KAJ4347993.1 hypothetical protein N0V89_009365 [Didymosphaeria variabile]
MEAPAPAPVSAPAEVVPSVENPTHDDKHEDLANKPALTPPTSEDMDKRDERMSSELSELDSDDGEDIEPDHYWDGGKIPVFKPTMDQFRNFKRFIDKIDKYGMKSGIVKVIPPTEWRDSLPDLSEAVKTIKVKNPITQEFAGQHGIYTQANIEKQRSYNLPEWKAVTEEAHHQPPVRRGERRRAAAEAPSRNRSTRAQTNTANADGASPAPKRGPGRPRRGRAAKKEEVDDEDTASIDVPPTPKSPGPEEDKKTSVKKIKEEELDESPVRSRGRQPRGRQPRGDTKKSTASRRMNNRTAMADYVDEAAFEDFDYHLDNVSEFSADRCKELEENYWKTVNFGQPMYGADMPGSLFDERTTSWNVAKLPNLLDVLGTKVPGVNTAYLYLGMWKATFAWHLEDVDLYSINYIHFGAPKQWYSISQADARKFEAAMKQIWPNDAKNCSQFLRHKTYLISPEKLEKNFGIKVNRLVHYEGEFVITYPYGYHSGYNIGYNCAESVNFANESWLSYGRIAKKCLCESDSVWVDVNEIERKLRGEPTPEYIEETDSEGEDEIDHLPSPPPSVAGKARSKPGRKPAGNKRKRGNKEPEEAPKRKVRRIRIRIKVPGRGMPCILCPNDVEYDELLPTDNGMKAHRICADYTPETYILQKNGVETICNVANIGKDRLELKCNYCRSKRGAVFQCSQKKCTRAFHATCAMAAGVQVDLGPMPTFDEEGTEYYYDGYDFRCRFHRPKKRNNKTVDVDYLEKDKFIMNYAKGLKPKDAIQFQYVGGEMYQIYGGLVVENRPGEQALLVDVLPDGDRVEVEWKYILKLAPEDSQRPKPSANAKPLPDHLKENDASLDISNRTDGVPEMGDPFHDPNSDQKWAEFNTAEAVIQKVAKVDFSKPNHVWFYLGKNSTEARPQYTHDLSKRVHNPKSNFLDTVKPPPPVIPHYQYQQRSYPASYPIKPAPGPTYGIPPRTPTQQQQQQQQPKPYQYKPKESMMHTFRAPAYNPDTRKNPNSPVAHQPNVTYDYRAAGSPYGQSTYHSSYHSSRPSQGGYIPYAPPQSYSTNAKSPTTSKPAPLTGMHQYAQSAPSSALQPNPYQLPPLPYSQSQGPVPRPVYSPPAGRPGSQSQPYHGGAPASHTMSNPTGTSKPPMYATMHSSLSAQPPSSQAEYLAYVTKYPYLKNAFLRRAKTYISPYSPNGGFTPEWAPKVSSASSGPLNMMPPMRPGQPSPGLGLNFGGAMSPSLPMPRPTAQFQSPDAFRQDLNKAPRPLSGAPKWETMLKHLGTTTGQPAPSNSTTSHSPLPALAPAPVSRPVPGGTPLAPTPMAPQTPSTSQQPTKSASPLAIDPALQSHTLPLPPPSAVSHPTPTPLGEKPNTPQRPDYSPISDNGETRPVPLGAAPSNVMPPAHTGETWRYS